MTHDLEARLRAAYAPLAPDPARVDDLAATLLDAPQAPAPGRLGRVLPWGVAIAATLVGAFLLARGPGPADRAPRPAHDGPAVTAFVDARGRLTLAGVDGRALRTWELGDLPIDFAIPAEIGQVLATEVAPYAPPVEPNAVPRTPDTPTLGPAFHGPSPVALVIDAAPDAPWRHVETILLGAAHARMSDLVFLDPMRTGPPIVEQLPTDDAIVIHDDVAIVHFSGRRVDATSVSVLEHSRVGVVLRPAAGGGPAARVTSSPGVTIDLGHDAGLTALAAAVSAGLPVDERRSIELSVIPGQDGDTISAVNVFGVLRVAHGVGVDRVLFAAGAGRRSK